MFTNDSFHLKTLNMRTACLNGTIFMLFRLRERSYSWPQKRATLSHAASSALVGEGRRHGGAGAGSMYQVSFISDNGKAFKNWGKVSGGRGRIRGRGENFVKKIQTSQISFQNQSR